MANELIPNSNRIILRATDMCMVTVQILSIQHDCAGPSTYVRILYFVRRMNVCFNEKSREMKKKVRTANHNMAYSGIWRKEKRQHTKIQTESQRNEMKNKIHRIISAHTHILWRIFCWSVQFYVSHHSVRKTRVSSFSTMMLDLYLFFLLLFFFEHFVRSPHNDMTMTRYSELFYSISLSDISLHLFIFSFNFIFRSSHAMVIGYTSCSYTCTSIFIYCYPRLFTL